MLDQAYEQTLNQNIVNFVYWFLLTYFIYLIGFINIILCEVPIHVNISTFGYDGVGCWPSCRWDSPLTELFPVNCAFPSDEWVTMKEARHTDGED
jgi:hypothetical protein